MNKNKINIIKSTGVPLPIENIDTDQIIPARFLKKITKEGFGKNLFADWKQKKDFILNNKRFHGKILVAGRNFGCGSSREHAIWALVGYGFKAIVSSFFADIFKNNALNNRLLPVQVSEKILKKIFGIIGKNPKIKITVDIENQKIIIPENNIEESFFIDPYKRICLMNGYDDIDYLIGLKDKIIEFEKNKRL